MIGYSSWDGVVEARMFADRAARRGRSSMAIRATGWDHWLPLLEEESVTRRE